MVARDDPLIGKLGAFHFAGDIPNGAQLVILLRNEVDANASGPEVIAERKRALPALRYARSSEGLEDGRRITIAKGDGDDMRLIVVAGDTRAVGKIGGRSDAGCLRVAEVEPRLAVDPAGDGLGQPYRRASLRVLSD